MPFARNESFTGLFARKRNLLVSVVVAAVRTPTVPRTIRHPADDEKSPSWRASEKS